MAQTTSAQSAAPARFSDVKGWFWPADQLLFDWFLARQERQELHGDLLELGAYLGKSAIFMGSYLREDETFTVCDLFDSPAPDDPNSEEMDRSYATLTRRAFEANYLSFHDDLPVVVQAPTSVIAGRVSASSCRFIHVDASHLYEHVHGDIEAARSLIAPDGIVAFDDFRAEHCPGVAAAVWGAVATTGLRPIAITGTKLYGTWSDPAPAREELLTWLSGRSDMWHGVEEVAGAPLIRIDGKKAKPPTPPKSKHGGATPSTAKAKPPAPRQPLTRRLARTLLPRR
ncbi:class I SAM-dependent methyltransferase [Streptomyces sp. BR1]|uniref:class I SAM-dependent methyltransferase n=1 Tax=Streptomyces sp. BR1 TaxID=1592323 RepID=UPI00402B108C